MEKLGRIKVGSGEHGKASFFLYGSIAVVDKLKNKIEKIYGDPNGPDVFVAMGFVINDYYITEDPSSVMAMVVYHSGYRGKSKIEIEGSKGYKFSVYKSPLGNTGISEGVIFSFSLGESPCVYGFRNGRLYGKPSSFSLRFRTSEKDGKIKVERLPSRLPLSVLKFLSYEPVLRDENSIDIKVEYKSHPAHQNIDVASFVFDEKKKVYLPKGQSLTFRKISGEEGDIYILKGLMIEEVEDVLKYNIAQPHEVGCAIFPKKYVSWRRRVFSENYYIAELPAKVACRNDDVYKIYQIDENGISLVGVRDTKDYLSVWMEL